MKIIHMTKDGWYEKGLMLFGKDQLSWKFICPACESIISIKDYQDLKAPDGAIAYACIGRFLPKSDSQKAFSKEKRIKGKPCDYTTGGVFNISPVEIEDQRYFNFYHEKDGK